MGTATPRRTDWHVPWIHDTTIILLFVLLTLIASVSSAGGVACEEQQEHCWNLFLFAQEQLGIRDDFPLASQPLNIPTTPTQRRNSCTVRRTFFVCLGNMSRSCRSDLAFRSAYHVLDRQLEQLNCSRTGKVFNMSDIPATPQPPAPPQCKFSHRSGTTQGNADKKSRKSQKGGINGGDNDDVTTQSGIYNYCALYGDPHLRTFDGEYVTCRAEGAWPLIDNQYFTVQITNRRNGQGYTMATSITEVTVIIKSHECAAENYLTFQAYSGHLPSVFEDGTFEAGPDGSVFIDEPVANEHVEIYLSYIDTRIVIRQIGSRFFSLAVKIPELIVNETLANAEVDPTSFLPVQLCMVGCPISERIDYREILVQSHPVSRDSRRADDSTALQTIVVSRDAALDICQRAHLLDYYLDSCVYDLMSTGDSNFSLAIRLAQSDEFRLMPLLLHGHQNRTSLDKGALETYERLHTPRDINSAHSMRGHLGYITSLSILILSSHLNYIHRTTFLLMLSVALVFLLCSIR